MLAHGIEYASRRKYAIVSPLQYVSKQDRRIRVRWGRRRGGNVASPRDKQFPNSLDGLFFGTTQLCCDSSDVLAYLSLSQNYLCSRNMTQDASR